MICPPAFVASIRSTPLRERALGVRFVPAPSGGISNAMAPRPRISLPVLLARRSLLALRQRNAQHKQTLSAQLAILASSSMSPLQQTTKPRKSVVLVKMAAALAPPPRGLTFSRISTLCLQWSLLRTLHLYSAHLILLPGAGSLAKSGRALTTRPTANVLVMALVYANKVPR